jgi:hypothetical protein
VFLIFGLISFVILKWFMVLNLKLVCFISYRAVDYVFSSFWFANSKAYGVVILSDSATDTKV